MNKKSFLSGLCKSVTAIYLGSLPLLALAQEKETTQEYDTFQELKESYDSKLNIVLEDNLLTFEEIKSLDDFLKTNLDKVKISEEKIPGLGPIAKKYPGLIDDKAKLMYPSDKLLSEEDIANVKKLLSYYNDEEFNEFKNKEQLTLQDFVLIYRLIEDKPEILTIECLLSNHAEVYGDFSGVVARLNDLEKKVENYTNVGAKILIHEVAKLINTYSSERDKLHKFITTYSNKDIKLPLLEEVFPEVNKTGKRGRSIPLFLFYMALPFLVHLSAKAYKKDLSITPEMILVNFISGFGGTLLLDGVHPSIFWIRNSLPVLYEAAKGKKKKIDE